MSVMKRMEDFIKKLDTADEEFLKELEQEFLEWKKGNIRPKEYKIWSPTGFEVVSSKVYSKQLKETNFDQVKHFLTFNEFNFPLLYWIKDINKNLTAIQNQDGSILILFNYKDKSIEIGKINKDWGKHRISGYLKHLSEHLSYSIQKEILKAIYPNQKEFLEEELGLTDIKNICPGSFIGTLNWSDFSKFTIKASFENNDYFISRLVIDFSPILEYIDNYLLTEFIIKEREFIFYRNDYDSFDSYRKDLSSRLKEIINDFYNLLRITGDYN